MFFASDNSGPVLPEVMAELARVNADYAMPYGADAGMDEVRSLIRETFEAPEAAVFLVTTGTAANALALATLAEPFETVFCTPVAHIHEDECNAPEFFTGGAKLTLAGEADKMTPETLRAAIQSQGNRGVHGPARGPVSLTNVTERGTVYTTAEVAALADMARGYGLPVHLDGARFANALAATGASPAEMSWKAGIDALSFGGTKNGLMAVEAVLLFDPARAHEFELRRKRGAHLVSKHRYLAAQMLAYLDDGLWLDLARAANAANARLVEAIAGIAGVELLYPPQANMTFARWPRHGHRRLHEAGAEYHLSGNTLEDDDPLEGDDPHALLGARLVTDWSTTDDDIDRFAAIMRE